jgi:hypothetical protein
MQGYIAISIHIAAARIHILQAFWDSPIEQLDSTGKDIYRNWRQYSGTERGKNGLSATYRGWSERSGVKLHGLPRVPRIIDAIDVRWGHRMKQFEKKNQRMTTEAAAEGFWSNPSQGLQRKESGEPGVLTTKSLWYSFQYDTVLDGTDYLLIQGLPLGAAGTFSSTELKNLGGEAYHAATIGTYVYAYYLYTGAPWWRQN